ncbi:phage portal protein [Halobacillus ihumii]|uniref:phage portal protein n=1 Tax=Halobacillus ihumii TaxID=2686092 RepID=UPI0013D63816|nr:phage portal protein [Halobacillus ihumii]
MALFKTGEYYPPIGHRERIERYAQNKKLFLGDHYDVFERLQNVPSDSVYISSNLAGLICKKSADFLFGEPPTFSAGREDESEEQKAIDRIVEQNDLNMKLQQSATGNAFRGDSFLKIRWGQKWGGKVPKKFDPFRVIIEPQNPKYVFPEVSEGDASEIEVVHVAYPTVVEGTGDEEWILHVESHYPNRIEYSKFEIMPFDTSGMKVVEWKIQNEIKSERRTVQTGVPFPLVVHIPNYSTDDDWQGIDDLSEHKPMFDEINNRLTRIAEILDKHADPSIAVPAGVLGEDESGNPVFAVGRDKVFEIMGKDDIVPQYITWDGQLQAAFEELDRVTEMLLVNAEIPALALGKGDSGTSGSSGLSIKFRMNSLLSKINRKRQFYNKGLKKMFMIAQMLEHEKLGSKANYDIVEPTIHFKDGLPQDDAELANIMNVRTGGKPTISQKTALMRIDGLTEEQAEAELQRMEEDAEKEDERNSEMFASPSAFQTPLESEDDNSNQEDNDESGE